MRDLILQLSKSSIYSTKPLKCCAYPNDRYELERGGISRTMAYREYYRAENAILRSVVSDREYAEHAVKYNQLSEYKKKIFRK
ncbi:hypothetical protein B5D01_15160 [Klebsiella pneumoniae]|nr:hypothetical protein [Klebsiella pneumoniae]